MKYKSLKISSDALDADAIIPSKYTRLGEDINPPLKIGQIPRNAKSLAIIMEDPDAPKGAHTYWVVWNIPIMSQINENEVPGEQGLNDFGYLGYTGPYSPSEIQHYVFKVYALDDVLKLAEGSCRRDLEEGLRYHTIAYGELTAMFKIIPRTRKDYSIRGS
jgi:Raf kinase inhibitor-like YbhB/YbcL family protein